VIPPKRERVQLLTEQRLHLGSIVASMVVFQLVALPMHVFVMAIDGKPKVKFRLIAV
jgi:hypothetical protein